MVWYKRNKTILDVLLWKNNELWGGNDPPLYPIMFNSLHTEECPREENFAGTSIVALKHYRYSVCSKSGFKRL